MEIKDVNGKLLKEIKGDTLACADLHNVYLSGADLCNANLYNANLSGADLFNANMCGVNIVCADLRKAKLSNANLTDANLICADLRGADLSYADLSYANLFYANLYGANLSYANLSYANLSVANLCGANLYGAELSHIDLSDVKLDTSERYRLGIILDEDMFGYKTVLDENNDYIIIKLKIPKGATVFCINGSKCRTNKCIVVDDCKGKILYSFYDENFTYELGKNIEIKDFDMRYNVECGSGIHFFRTEKEAMNY